jgi:2-polyprenyl-6-hydroxyphenyl methylase/3-demethylubiquinone-9 3-methyltransferase
VKELQSISGYVYSDFETNPSHDYLLPTVFAELDKLKACLGDREARMFELGCGNGSVAAKLNTRGWDIIGIDPSVEGIEQASKAYPGLKLAQGSAYDNLVETYGTFPVLMSLEVVEHVYAPRDYAKTAFNLLEPGGTAIFSTPYHGYLKNLAMALTGKMDAHFTALWDHGHIKFWSEKTLTELLVEAGFEAPRYLKVGRIPALAKSMVAIARRPRG